MDSHLSADERMSGNRRNGKMQEQTSMGGVTVSTPRDRNSTFEPQFIKKRETILAEEATLDGTEFQKVSGGDFYPDMLIREIK